MSKVIKSNLIQADTINLLHKFQILKTLTKEEIETLLKSEQKDYKQRIAKLIQYRKDELVVKEGEFDCWVFWVVKGAFEVIKDNVTIAVFNRPGEVFGEMSILSGDSRSASVSALEDGVCLSIDMSVFDSLQHSRMKKKITDGIQQLKSERLNITTNKLVAEKRLIAEQQKTLEMERERLNALAIALANKEKKLIERERELEKKKKHS